MLKSNVFLQKVLSFHARDSTAAATAAKGGRKQKQKQQDASDEMSCSSSKLSFKWDVGSCSSASSVAYSPLSLMSAPAKASEQTPSRKDYYMSRLSSMSQQSMLCSGGGDSSPKSMKNMDGEEEEGSCRMGQWITTDSDCKLCLHYSFAYYLVVVFLNHILLNLSYAFTPHLTCFSIDLQLWC